MGIQHAISFECSMAPATAPAPHLLHAADAALVKEHP